ncbi:MAG: ribonuclease H-like domain-containing protein [Anaerolineae bacterium]
MPGIWCEMAGVRCFRAEQTYPLSYQHGHNHLGEIVSFAPPSWSPFIQTSDGQELDVQRAIFLDTETTGLSRGPATYVFMVGIGRIEGEQFHLHQYFMPDYASEEGLLDLLTQDLRGREGLITFNGRCFDWPLLEMRYLLNRRVLPIVPAPHLDLLPLARRLWRRRLISCSLSSLEANLLGVKRSGVDVPSYLIPQLYQDYVDLGCTEPMAGVFYHNALDILSMVSLAITAGHTLSALDNPTEAVATDFLALGKLFAKLGRQDEALRAMHLAAERGNDDAETALAYQHWSLLLKRLGQWEQAVAIWESRLEGRDIYPYLELAKYYEHRLRDNDLAIQVAQQALIWLQADHPPLSRFERQQLQVDLNHRLERLERRRGCVACVDQDK